MIHERLGLGMPTGWYNHGDISHCPECPPSNLTADISHLSNRNTHCLQYSLFEIPTVEDTHCLDSGIPAVWNTHCPDSGIPTVWNTHCPDSGIPAVWIIQWSHYVFLDRRHFSVMLYHQELETNTRSFAIRLSIFDGPTNTTLIIIEWVFKAASVQAQSCLDVTRFAVKYIFTKHVHSSFKPRTYIEFSANWWTRLMIHNLLNSLAQSKLGASSFSWQCCS